MSNPGITLIICSHNPRPDYLRRTLDALKAQDLPQDQWEFLLVDNASKEPLAKNWDLSWHLNGRHVHESDLGLTPARLAAIRESRGELLVFVDDDNVLAGDYLSRASDLFARRADLGVASGRIVPEYETPPPDWFRPYESWIAVRRIEQSRWSNFYDPRSEPCGAGMCLRKPIALAYAQKARDNKRQQLLGRRGNSLLSGEDVAITKVALGMGYSMGQFLELNITHLIPSRRVSENYLFSLYCNLIASGRLISWMEEPGQKAGNRPDFRVLTKAALRFIKGNRVDRRLIIEEFRATNLVRKIVKEAESNPAMAEPVAVQRT
jgi:glycosyltransferase involved in cell wall biosynthesis